ncbi:MAG TPA: glycoside hydrolase family 99-like domain-containing protein [Blastocatellia bacterium]|nr:glycoside hydrolase family 99-like domain-containing protein [Blastocatellia bacterium]
MNDTNYSTGIRALRQPEDHELVISHLRKLLTEREGTIQSLRAQLDDARKGLLWVALGKLRNAYERSRARGAARPNGDYLNGAGDHAGAGAGNLDAANALLKLSRAALEKLRGNDVRVIAFYLPQYHPIPENDQWWGNGFTEWTNVTKARSNFDGHYQPHLPADLGFYDLRVPEAREKQAELASEYGIHGFCYHHYWFGGRRLLERPFNEVLSNGRPDFPFCICWANHNWTRAWDVSPNEILLAQPHSPEDDRNFIRSLFPAFEDRRYIRVNGKPLLLVFRVDGLPDAKQTSAIWREEMKKAGLGEIYLCAVQSVVIDPRPCEFDAAVEFPPNQVRIDDLNSRVAGLSPGFSGAVLDYLTAANIMIHKPKPDYTLFKSVMPGWDNTPRRQDTPRIFINSSPEAYEYWLGKTVEYTIANHRGDERLVFINAWNEWGEGAHLEPDRRYGRRFLEATRNVMSVARGNKK